MSSLLMTTVAKVYMFNILVVKVPSINAATLTSKIVVTITGGTTNR